jgi:hypothetical protein
VRGKGLQSPFRVACIFTNACQWKLAISSTQLAVPASQRTQLILMSCRRTEENVAPTQPRRGALRRPTPGSSLSYKAPDALARSHLWGAMRRQGRGMAQHDQGPIANG